MGAFLLAILCAVFLPVSGNAQTRVPIEHPLVGKWQWTRAVNKCTEVYEFRPDGTVPVTSGAEKTENTYTVSAGADENGFYRVTMRTMKDNGGKDCADDATDNTGQENTTYVLFNPERTMHLVCAEPNQRLCIGPLERIGR